MDPYDPSDEIPAEETSRLVEVYRAANLAQAHAIRAVLEEADIRVAIHGELLQGAVGELPMGWPTSPRVLVAEDDAEAARELIEGMELQSRREDADSEPSPEMPEQEDVVRCLSCNRIMAENEEKCPACGWSYGQSKET